MPDLERGQAAELGSELEPNQHYAEAAASAEHAQPSDKGPSTGDSSSLAPDNGANNADNLGGGIPFFITQLDKALLRQKGYTREQIARMKPTEAQRILSAAGLQTPTAPKPTAVPKPPPTEPQKPSQRSVESDPPDMHGHPAKVGNGYRPNLKGQIIEYVQANSEHAWHSLLGESPAPKKGGKKGELYTHCRFHTDDHASFRINFDFQKAPTGVGHCDSCGAGGDLFKVAARLNNTESDFPATLKWLAGLLSINGYHRNGHQSSNNGNSRQQHQANTSASQSPTRSEKPKHEHGPVIDKIQYEIRDLEGELKAIHYRATYQCVDDETGKHHKRIWWSEGARPKELPLYGIARIHTASPGQRILLVEGESAADSLWERGYLAIGTYGADGDPCDESLKPLLNFGVDVWADNDDAGRDHMQRNITRLLALGHQDIRRVEWAEAPRKGDAADFTGDIDALLAQAVQPEPPDPYPNQHAVDLYTAYSTLRAQSREYTWDGLIHRGHTAVLTGQMAAGKSTLLMCLARAWGLGVSFLERKCAPSKTLVVCSQKEYSAWADAIGFWQLEDLIFAIESSKIQFSDRRRQADWFDHEMRRWQAETFVLDTLFDFFGMPPNTSGDANRIVMAEQSPLLEVVLSRGWSGVVSGHPPKGEAQNPNPRDPEEAFGGVSAWTAQHRMRMRYRRTGGPPALITGKGGYGDEPIFPEKAVLLNEDTRLVELAGDWKEHMGTIALPILVEALRDLGGVASMSKLIAHTGKPEAFIRAGIRAGKQTKDGRSQSIWQTGKGRATKYWNRKPLEDDDSQQQFNV